MMVHWGATVLFIKKKKKRKRKQSLTLRKMAVFKEKREQNMHFKIVHDANEK